MLCRDPGQLELETTRHSHPRQCLAGVGSVAWQAVTMPGSWKKARGISRKTQGFLCCRSERQCCHLGLVPQGWGLPRHARRPVRVPPSVLLPALPRNVKWHFCFTAVAATAWGGLTERLLLALMLSPSPHPSTGDYVTGKAGDVPIPGCCCWLSVAKAQVGMPLCVLPVPRSRCFLGAETCTGLGPGNGDGLVRQWL